MLGASAVWFPKAMLTLKSRASKEHVPTRRESSWKEEKKDILERANWLGEQIIVEPEKLLKAMPFILGPEYGGQWAIYACSMYVSALSNISYLYPEERESSLVKMQQLICLALTPAMKRFDTMDWGEDPIEAVKGKKGHMTYLSTIAWMISIYKLDGGDGQFDTIFHDCCEGINRRMRSRKDMNVPSFTNGIVFVSDMVCSIVALHNYGVLYNNEYDDTVQGWLTLAKTNLMHRTGLLDAVKSYKHGKYIRGSFTALTNYFLTLLDDDNFTMDQHIRMKSIFNLESNRLFGLKEYQRKTPDFKFDFNAGPIMFGLSPAGTAIAIGSATYCEDWEYRSKLLNTAEIAGDTVYEKGSRHYRLGEFALVGEAMVLAMKTNVRRARNKRACS